MDLAHYIGKSGDTVHRSVFQKCFDKNAAITFTMKVREIF